MKFIKSILKGQFMLYADNNGNIGLNVFPSNGGILCNWELFKKEVDEALAHQRTISLSSFSLEDLEAEVFDRRTQLKSKD